MEGLLLETVRQSPILAVVISLWWYHRKDLLARIEKLDQRFDRVLSILLDDEPGSPPN